MIIELIHERAKYVFDDEGPVLVQMAPDSLTAIQWSKKEEDTGACPMIPEAVVNRWKSVREKALGAALQKSSRLLE